MQSSINIRMQRARFAAILAGKEKLSNFPPDAWIEGVTCDSLGDLGGAVTITARHESFQVFSVEPVSPSVASAEEDLIRECMDTPTFDPELEDDSGPDPQQLALGKACLGTIQKMINKPWIDGIPSADHYGK